MKVSIIMPIYNAEKQLKKAIDSVLEQTYKDIELILVNDGSTDESLAICKEYENCDKRVRLFDIENSGPGAARNIGLKRVRGAYTAFVDADDYLESSGLEMLISIGLKDNYDVVASNHFRVDSEITVSMNAYSSGEIDKNGSDEQKQRYNQFKTSSSFGYVWGKIYKTSFLKANNINFSEARKVFLEDTLFNLKVFSYKPKYYVLNEPLYYYNILEDSLSNKTEDITDRAIKVLEDYESFLSKRNTYDENMDLFLPLASRVIAWSLFKSMENEFKVKVLYEKVTEFKKNETIRRLFSKKNCLIELRKINSILQAFLYSFIVICIRYNLAKTLTITFYMSYPLFKVYIKNSLKN